MKIFNILVLIFICIISSVKADSKHNITTELKKGGKLIFIRHAYAPGGGDPENFDIIIVLHKEILMIVEEYSQKKLEIFLKKTIFL